MFRKFKCCYNKETEVIKYNKYILEYLFIIAQSELIF